MSNKKIRNKFKKLKRKNVPKKKHCTVLWWITNSCTSSYYNPKKKKKTANGRQATFISAGLKLPKINK